MNNKRVISIVVPVYNEEEVIDLFYAAILPYLDNLPCDWELVFVNDGSIDDTVSRILALRARESRVKLIDLSRNFGKEAALTAGLDFVTGDAAIPVDVDLQDPPEVIAQMVALWMEGYEVVHATRRTRGTDSWGKRTTAQLFYRVFNRLAERPIPTNTGDFRLLGSKALAAAKQYRERNRFMKGICGQLGFKETQVYFDRAPRAGGTTKWSPLRLMGLAIDGITSFSVAPLRLWSIIGFLTAVGSLAYAAVLIVKVVVFGRDVHGYASIMVTMLFLGGLIMLSVGMLGEYVGRIYTEIKQRPIYTINDIYR